MRILMLAQHYAPEEVSGAVLATELAEELVSRGHDLTFVTTAPSYPKGEVFSGYRNLLFWVEKRTGVRVIRVWSYITRKKKFLPRALNYGTFSATAFWGGIAAGRPDIIFSYSPPLTLGLSVYALARIFHIPWVLRVEDMYPEAAIVSGVLTNQKAIRFFSSLERFLYRKADHVSLISEGFRKNLLEKGVPSRKLSVEPVWVDSDSVFPQPKENRFREKFGLTGKFVILYAGNLGITSDLETVLEAARMMNHQTEIVFLFVGEGVMKEKIQKKTAKLNLKQVRFLPFQAREIFSEMMAAADLGLVTINSASARFSLPSKAFSVMASGRPILGVSPINSELEELILGNHCGVNSSPNHPGDLVENILELKNNPETARMMALAGREAVVSHYSRKRCVNKYEKLFEQEWVKWRLFHSKPAIAER
jgi:colanic acid biosynthesis glycosyl transferase WcaI